jgi:hypothetical protein
MDEIRRVFVDTSAWLALIKRDERRHGAATSEDGGLTSSGSTRQELLPA